MKLGIIISVNQAETVWNAFRLGSFALEKGDQVKAFLIGEAVESESQSTDSFPITQGMKNFVDAGVSFNINLD